MPHVSAHLPGIPMRLLAVTAALLLSSAASAQIAPECKGVNVPNDYSDIVQQDFLMNYYALATTFSAIHGPIPHEPGGGALGLDMVVMPPLGCEKRLAVGGTKTEDTNKTPIIPRPRVTFALPALGPVLPWGGVAYVPPVKVFGTTNVIVSAEVGLSGRVGDTVQLGGRFHATSQKSVGEFATPFIKGDDAVDDMFVASTFGFDLMLGLDFDVITPFAAFGLTDASTFFYIGDDGVITNNYHPYFGPVFSLGAEGLVADHFRWGGEFYGAPGGYSLPDLEIATEKGAARYGRMYTARFRFAYEF
ncbi:MAG: hypothetical protein ACI8PZ_006174 [Myxococcota bacterium]|jgi:hypothetical protein